MSWFSKKVLGKIKKIKPLKVLGKVGSVVAKVAGVATSVIGVGGAVLGAVKNLRGAAHAAVEETKRVAAEEGLTEAEAAQLVGQRAVAGAQAGIFAGRASTQNLVLIGAAVVIVFLLLRKRG